ncbi:esterase/lipase family protein [Sinorhizobium meliloti]|uniref:esterase/lipase family protein n=1 Tax=Rhizobium meliloti TaxID=382 RepID=UPI003F166E14
MNRRLQLLFLSLTLLVCSLAWTAHANFVEPPSGQRRLIVFVHGLGNSGGKNPHMAWSSSTPDKSWPALMNRETSFQRNFAIFMAQYGTNRFSGNFHIQGLSIELGAILTHQAKIADYDEVYFIAHSLGGIVVRNLMIEDKAIRAKAKGIFLFASPLGGSDIAGLASVFGIASIQTAQLGESPDDPDAVFNALKDIWYREEIDIPSFCAYETETTKGVIVVKRSSVEPLCSEDVKPLRGAHTPIVQPPKRGAFFAHDLLKGWMRTLLSDFEEGAGAAETTGQIVLANCSGNEAYRGPYGKVHSLLKDLLELNGADHVRYSLPLSQIWAGDNAKSQFFITRPPSDIVIHLSCFQNTKADSRDSVRQRDRNFLSMLKSFRGDPTNFIVYSRAFDRNGCDFMIRKLEAAGLAPVYRDRIKMIAVKEGEMPGDNSSADDTIIAATLSNRASWVGRTQANGCFK